MKIDSRRGLQHFLLVAGLVVSFVGCGHARPSSSPFIRGAPDAGVPARPPSARAAPSWLSSHMEEIRRQTAAHAIERRKFAPRTVEATDPALREALARLARVADASAHVAVATEYRRIHVNDRALDHLDEALRLSPRIAGAWDLRARIWRDWGVPGPALSDAYRAVAFAPADAGAHNTLGTVLAALGHIAHARREFLRATDLDPNAGWALNNLCRLAIDEGQATDARLWCERALAADPGLTVAAANLGVAQALGRAHMALAPDSGAEPRPH